jgi:flagellar hook-associated protein 3 FlgL
LIGVANQKDSSGRTLFGGLGGSSNPFVEVFSAAGSGVQFSGLRGQEATGNLTLPQSFDGNAVFMRVPQGNGSFTMALGAANGGGVRTDTGTVTDPSLVTGQAYSIDFSNASGSMQYSVTNITTGLPVAGQTGQPYNSGSSIAFDGVSFAVTGSPANGDTLALTPNTDPTDIFAVLQKTIDTLRGATQSGSPQVLQTLGQAMTELDAGHDRILQARSLAGSWLNRADATDSLLADRSIAHKAEQANLEDLDMVQGISDFQSQQTGLQAALQSYAQVQRLSLFQYIS